MIILFLFVIIALYDALPLPLPFNEFSYIMARNRLKQIDQFQEGSSPNSFPLWLKEKENVLNIYFEKLKAEELKSTNSSNPTTTQHFYPSRPIETELNLIQSSYLYKQLKLLPKGGNLHMHEGQMLNRRKLLELIKNSTEYDILYICDKANSGFCQLNMDKCVCKDFYLTYIIKVNESNPDGWIRVKDSNWTIEEIVNKTTLIGILNERSDKVYATDTAARWAVSLEAGLFDFYTDIIRYNKTRFDYMKACLDDALEENVQLIEFRRSNFDGLYTFDENGNRLLNISSLDEIRMLEEFKKDYIQRNRDFIDFLFIIYGSRRNSKEEIRQSLNDAIQIQSKFPEMIRGYDLVGEEDLGHTLLFHSETLIKGFNYSYYSIDHSFSFDFHVGETNWPSDMTIDKYNDDTSTLNNIYDAIVFKTHRVGHGLGFFKHPKMYDFLKKRNIAIEVCPASNQILGYVPDVRNHPAVNYFKSGLPIVIAGDDPGSFGYNELTFDYYLAFMAWDLNLYDLKEIANNSIRFSTATDSVKLVGYTKFAHLWNKFVNSTYDLACNQLQLSIYLIQTTNVYPSYGPNDRSILITIYGNGFENILCQKIICYFNNVKTNGYLNRLNEILCETPLGFENNQISNISLGYKDIIIKTDLKFKFVSPNLINIKYDNDIFSLKNILYVKNYYCNNNLYSLIVLSILLFVVYNFCNKFKLKNDATAKK